MCELAPAAGAGEGDVRRVRRVLPVPVFDARVPRWSRAATPLAVVTSEMNLRAALKV